MSTSTYVPYGNCDNGYPKQCTDTSDLRHFRSKSSWCRSIHWTFRHHRKNQRHFGTGAKVSYTFRHH